MLSGLKGRGHSDSHVDSHQKRRRISEQKVADVDQLEQTRMEELQVIKSDIHSENENDSGKAAISELWIELNSQPSERTNARREGNVTEATAWMEHCSSDMVTHSHNFDKDTKTFSEGQIWAIYDDYGLPRRYVEIELVSDAANYSSVTLLKSSSYLKSEEHNIKEASWFRPVCGYFTPHLRGLVISRYSFSHMLYCQSQERNGISGYDVYPREGELWAVYMDGKKNCCPRFQKYQLVEIVDDVNGSRVKVAYLTSIKGGIGVSRLFRRRKEYENQVFVEVKDFNLFSHQVPFSKIPGNNCFEVDPALFPPYAGGPTDALEPMISSELIRMKFLDSTSLMLKEKFRQGNIWALYDDFEGLPRKYGLLQNVDSREFLILLEPCPVSKDEMAWYGAGIPIACGNFRLKKSTLGLDHSALSHPVQYDWDSSSQQCTIHPRKGEVWGIYKNLNLIIPGKYYNKKPTFEYDIVQILTNFSKNEGVKVVHLDRVEDSSCLFRSSSTAFEMQGSEVHRFSHQIQKIEIGEGFLLDPLVVSVHAKNGYNSSRGDAKELTEVVVEVENQMDANLKKFLAGEVWALYEESDMMPRSYAVVCNTRPRALTVEVMMLKPHPISEEVMECLEKELPISCGIFHAEQVTKLKDAAEFSHQVRQGEDGKRQTSFYKIFPQRGEVWAVYRNWKHIDRETRRYQMVEIISSYDEEYGIQVAPIFEVGGSEHIYRRHVIKGFELVKSIPSKEMVQFSHRVPAVKTSKDGGGVHSKGHWKLDAAAIPNLLH